jgi:hypothetical protein
MNGTMPGARLTLEYPKSVGVYDEYLQAQSVVDHLSDQQFPVQNIALIGTDLKSVERVTGRLTRARAATAGALDFSSISQIVATKYEVLVEHRFVEQARALLATMPAARS